MSQLEVKFMLNFLVAVMLYAFWISVGIHFILLFGMRIFYSINRQLSFKESLMVIFIPFSIGLYLKETKDTSFISWYNIFICILFFSIAIGSIMIYYAHFG